MSFAFFFFACIGKQIDDMRGREFTPHISYDEEKRQMSSGKIDRADIKKQEIADETNNSITSYV